MSSISSLGSNNGMTMMHGSHGMRRPDPGKMAENLFDQLDTSGQGYLQKTDFESAFGSTSSASSDVEALFSQLDGDSDGKVTKQEFSDALTQLAEQLDQQFQSSRMHGAMQMGGMGGMGRMPPPPPPPGDAGFTKDELSSQLEEIGTTDSERSNLISSIVENFEAADTDGDGKVSFKEAMTFDQSTRTAETAGTTSASTGKSDTEPSESEVMMQILKLLQTYLADDRDRQSSLSVIA
jgi:Ca2+-binding EF-hand superfamily protein